MHPVCHPHGNVFDILFISGKSKDISNIFVKSILAQKIVSTSINDIIMSPKHFEIKKKYLHSF